MVKNPAHKSHFFEKTHTTHFQEKKTPIFREKQAPQGYPLADARGARGAGPGPRLNGKGQGAGPGPNVNGRGQGAGPGPNVKLVMLCQHLPELMAKCGGEAPPNTVAAVFGLHACRNVPTESGNTVETSLLMVVVRERLTKVKAFPFRDACPSISDLKSNMVKMIQYGRI